MQYLLGIKFNPKSKKNNLEKILLYLENPEQFFHVVSLNPETMVQSQQNAEFKKVLSEGDIQLIDGVGVQIASSILGFLPVGRVTGVDFMKDVLKLCKDRSLRVLFLGGRAQLAEDLANRYQQIYPHSSFKGFFGISDIHNLKKEENEKIFSIVADYKPQILFVAFGSPAQELWLYRNQAYLNGVICMGVGGSFDFLSGTVQRAPLIIRKLGLEWLFRLIIEPWRWKRQLRLIKFMYLVLKQRFGLL